MPRLLLATLLVLGASPIASQVDSARAPSDLRLGDRIRIEYMRGDLRVARGARFLALSGDTAVIEIQRLQHTVAMSDVQVIAVPAGRRDRLPWAAAGVGFGSVVGLLGSLIDRKLFEGFDEIRRVEMVCDPECHPVPVVKRVPYPNGRRVGLIGGGAVLGGVIGAVLPGVRWRNLELRVAEAASPAPRATLLVNAGL